jgi:hypothetical protein
MREVSPHDLLLSTDDYKSGLMWELPYSTANQGCLRNANGGTSHELTPPFSSSHFAGAAAARLAVSCSVPNSPTLRESFSSSPASVPL